MNIWFWDDWCIGKFEKFAHWFQQQTGKTNYFLCWICMWCVIFLAMLHLVVDISLRQEINLFLIVAIGIFLAHVFFLPREEEAALERLEKGVANPRKISDRFFRALTMSLSLYFVFISLFAIAAFFGDDISKKNDVFSSLYAFFLLFFYLPFEYWYSCDPLPPCRGKLGEKIGAWFWKPAVAEAPHRG